MSRPGGVGEVRPSPPEGAAPRRGSGPAPRRWSTARRVLLLVLLLEILPAAWLLRSPPCQAPVGGESGRGPARPLLSSLSDRPSEAAFDGLVAAIFTLEREGIGLTQDQAADLLPLADRLGEVDAREGDLLRELGDLLTEPQVRFLGRCAADPGFRGGGAGESRGSRDLSGAADGLDRGPVAGQGSAHLGEPGDEGPPFDWNRPPVGVPSLVRFLKWMDRAPPPLSLSREQRGPVEAVVRALGSTVEEREGLMGSVQGLLRQDQAERLASGDWRDSPGPELPIHRLLAPKLEGSSSP